MTAPHLFKLRKDCLTGICHGAMVGNIHEKSRIGIRIRYAAMRTVPKCLGSTLIVTTIVRLVFWIRIRLDNGVELDPDPQYCINSCK